MKKTVILLSLLFSSSALANIPATPVMTLYRFNGALENPYYEIATFQESDLGTPAGTLYREAL